MPRPYIAVAVRRQVKEDAGLRCGYCLTPQSFTAMPMHVEHIIPIAAGGASTVDNLWLACALCNGFKGIQIQATDPETGLTAQLFHPRHQYWREHFRWSDDGIQVEGITATGRATVVALRLNNEQLVRARRRWVLAGWHPPE